MSDSNNDSTYTPELCTGLFWWTFEEATRWANEWTKVFKDYNTAIRKEPIDPNNPEECWAVTNKYDPRVAAAIGGEQR